MVDKVDKSRTTSVSNRPNNISQFEKYPKTQKIIIPKDNLYVSVFTGLDSILISVKPEQTIIPH